MRFASPGFCVVFLWALVSGYWLPGDEFIRGDANMDGEVNTTDATMLVGSAVVSAELPCLDAADVDDNGIFNVSPAGASDLSALNEWLYSLSAERSGRPLPDPFPDPGVDLTRDGLGCADCTITPAGGADPDYRFDWIVEPPRPNEGEDVEIFLLVTSAEGFDGFSFDLHVNTTFLDILDVDMFRTDHDNLPPGFASSSLFQTSMTDSGDPDFPLSLKVGAVFADDSTGLFQPISTTVNERGVTLFKLVRILAIVQDLPPDFPLGPVTLGQLYTGPYLLSDGTSFPVDFNLVSTFSGSPFKPLHKGVPTAGYVVGEIFIRGDFDGNGQLQMSDPVSGLRYMFQEDSGPQSFDAADTNDDGVNDLSDSIYALRYLFVNGPESPAPFLFCWFDPTEDELAAENQSVCGPDSQDPCTSPLHELRS